MMCNQIDCHIAFFTRPPMRFVLFKNAAGLAAWAPGATLTPKPNQDGHSFVGVAAPADAPDDGVTITVMAADASAVQIATQIATTAVEVTRGQYRACGFRNGDPVAEAAE